ncbi:MAG TPA: FAD-dependent oxidoreductase [Bacteroidales bacterium]|jgi:uncharacterized FAD-dependent dehydrogenase|nr:FAD-dependent oxidoreductase [Bacteroidales bacterium]
MTKIVNLNLDPEVAADEKAVFKYASKKAGILPSDISSVRILRRSIDARKKNIIVNLQAEVFIRDEKSTPSISPFKPADVRKNREVLIIGAGPAGLFAALRLIELGLKPVIIERGKDVSSRKRDIAKISREHLVDPDSNYCFGEGGAGTFSDGKLYTRSKKRGDNRRILELLCLHGADESILYDAHPHLGTDKLPGIIKNIRRTITDNGGVMLFETRMTGLVLENGSVKGIITNGNEKYLSPSVILSTGHSARDIYSMLHRKGILLEQKSFAMGVRVEHPQDLIDSIQYHGRPRGPFLPAASYSLVRQVDNRGVYSFCMCPGGFIVPAATSQVEIVVNGMSPSGRNSPFANSGIVVEIRPEDLSEYSRFGELAGLKFQMEVERLAWEHGGRTQFAPAQRLTDFLKGKPSGSLPRLSYFPGAVSSPMHDWLPPIIGEKLQKGFAEFGKMMKGFITEEAVILGVESRTSSPVRIPRNAGTMEHVSLRGLYPCGEGSGYSGGIVSSAVDGVKVAEAVALQLQPAR